MDVHIRWMIRRDMPEVINIEKGSFENPWSEKDFIRCLRERSCIGMVAEHDNRIVGFMVYELHKSRLHILDFAVHPDCLRDGVGRQMVKKLIGKLSQQRRRRIKICVCERNLKAQKFFRAMGFRATSVLSGHFEDSGEDAYVMHYTLPNSSSYDPNNRMKGLLPVSIPRKEN